MKEVLPHDRRNWRKDLTNRQREILATIVDFYNENGRMPTMQNVADVHGITMEVVLLNYIRVFRKKGYVIGIGTKWGLNPEKVHCGLASMKSRAESAEAILRKVYHGEPVDMIDLRQHFVKYRVVLDGRIPTKDGTDRRPKPKEPNA